MTEGQESLNDAARLIGAAALDAALAPFGRSRMLPAVAYTSPAVLTWEWRHFFADGWTCLGRRPHATQQVYALGEATILVTSSAQQNVRAFANVCRHRGHELLPGEGSGSRDMIVCPYHGWAYRLDGTLAAAPRMGDLDQTEWGLVELPLTEWHGWLFVNANGGATPFADHLGELDRYVAGHRPEALHVNARHRYEVRANWKLIAENYHECYHCPMIHPELCAVSSPTSGTNWHGPGAWVGGSMRLLDSARTMSLDGRSLGRQLPGVDPGEVIYVGLFPNLLISLHPDYVLTHRLVPVAPERTVVECEWLFPEAQIDPGYAVDFWDTTNRQDWAAVESVQRGLASPHHRPGPLAPNENAVYDWITMLARGYRDPVDLPRRCG